MQFSFYYSIARILVVTGRPLFLLFIISIDKNKESQSIALIFTIIMTLFQVFNCDSHLNYYKEYFNKKEKKRNIGLLYTKYINFFYGAIMILILPLITINYFIFDSILLAIPISFMILFEKIADEYQRFQIFSKKFNRWSSFALIMFILPILSTVFIFFIMKADVVICYIFSCTIIYSFLLMFIFNDIIIIKRKLKERIKVSLAVYFENIHFVIINFANGNVMLISRYFILITEPIFFSLFVLSMNIVGLISTGIDMFYFSYNRKNFVNKKKFYIQVLRDKSFLFILTCLFLLSILINYFLLVSKNYPPIEGFTISLILGSIGLLFTISLVFYQSLYWHKLKKERMLLEVLFYLLFLILFSISFLNEFNLVIGLLFILSIMFLRILALIYFLKG